MSLLGDLGTAIKNKLGGASVDNTVPRYDGTTCKLQSSEVTISDTNVVTASGGFVGNLTGNADTATKLQTARTIQTNLGSAGGASFDGTANVTPGVTGTLSVLNGGTGATTAAGALANIVGYTPIQQGGGTSQFTNKLFIGWEGSSLNLQVDSTNFASTWPISISRNAATATKLQTARKINGVSFDGTADITIPSIPTGGIIMWSGSIVSIPTGWALCNGQNGTPNLQDRFVIGAGSAYAVGNTGGSKDAIVVSHTHTQAAHNHTATTSSDGAHTHNFTALVSSSWGASGGSVRTGADSYITTSSAGAHTHSLTTTTVTPAINSTGSDGTNANLPPYYALAYIMKL